MTDIDGLIRPVIAEFITKQVALDNCDLGHDILLTRWQIIHSVRCHRDVSLVNRFAALGHRVFLVTKLGRLHDIVVLMVVILAAGVGHFRQLRFGAFLFRFLDPNLGAALLSHHIVLRHVCAQSSVVFFASQLVKLLTCVLVVGVIVHGLACTSLTLHIGDRLHYRSAL